MAMLKGRKEEEGVIFQPFPHILIGTLDDNLIVTHK
jgi:hypothetical protein